MFISRPQSPKSNSLFEEFPVLSGENFKHASFNLQTEEVTYLSDAKKHGLEKVKTIALLVIFSALVFATGGLVALTLLSKKVRRILSLHQTKIADIGSIHIANQQESDAVQASGQSLLEKQLLKVKNLFSKIKHLPEESSSENGVSKEPNKAQLIKELKLEIKELKALAQDPTNEIQR